MKTRYSYGGDEHIFVECDEEMSLDAFFKSLSITSAVKKARIKGVTEICPANASFQIKFNPDIIRHDERAEGDREGGQQGEVDDQDEDHRNSGAL
jgi:urea carboxylase